MIKKKTLKIAFVNLLVLFVGIILLEIIFGGWLSPNRLNKLNLIGDAKGRGDRAEKS